MDDPIQHPLSDLATKFLPQVWRDNGNLPALNLMLWGLLEAGHQLVVPGPPPDVDDLRAAVMGLMMEHPQGTLDYLLGTEGDNAAASPLVDELECATSAAQAASTILRSLHRLRAAQML